jgi:hypothetical protein
MPIASGHRKRKGRGQTHASPVRHVLLGKKYFCEWIEKGIPLEIYGTVTACNRAQDNAEALWFTVVIEAEPRRIIINAQDNCQAPESILIEECWAWGGCLLYEQLHRLSTINRKKIPKDSLQFISPTGVYNMSCECSSEIKAKFGRQVLPCLTLYTSSWYLKFQVKESSIQNAGLGVFVQALPQSKNSDKSHFVLPPGLLIDMGVYAPLTTSDKITTHVSGLKRFIHGPASTIYNFETALNDKCSSTATTIFDPMDHVTGELQEIYKQSILPYVNEADGSEPPNVRSFHDPMGAVHYLFGCQGVELAIEAYKEYEIFIDYGDPYEKQRLQQNYSRLSIEDPKREELQEVIDREDAAVVRECKKACPRAVMDGFWFLDKFTMLSLQVPLKKLSRALYLCLILYKRCRKLVADYDRSRIDDTSGRSNDYNEFMDKNTEQYAKQVVCRLLKRFPSTDSLYDSLVTEECKQQLLQILDCENQSNLSCKEFVASCI